MKKSEDQFEKLLGETSISDIKRTLTLRGLVPSLSQAAKLRQHIRSLPYELKTIRLGIIHTYTSELLDPWLHVSAALNELQLEIYHAPYGATVQEAIANSGLSTFAPDITLLLLTKEDLHPCFQMPTACIDLKNRADLLRDIQVGIQGLVRRFREIVGGQIIVTILPNPELPALGLYDVMAEHSETYWWQQIKTALASDLRHEFSGVRYLDLDQLVMQVGRRRFFDARLWYSSVFPFSPEGGLALSDAVTSIAAANHLSRAKVIVVDADNTLWGGVIGEDGINGIALGQEYPGRAYVDFQKKLLSLQQRGFILALCSKNNPEDVNEVFQNHPHQILKSEHFAAQRVNWLPKPDNLKSLAQELNLGLDSFIFIDDSDYECSAVRHALPSVEIVQIPTRPVDIPACLDGLARLEVVSLTAEDIEKAAMYAQERLRKSQLEQLTKTGGGIEEYLKSLNMNMTVGVDDVSLVARLAQLTQKTNQFNLTTKRYSEEDISGMIRNDAFSVYHFSLADNFGSSGIVGLAIVEQRTSNEARLDTFLMSCRVIGRRAEHAFLHTIIKNLLSKGITELTSMYIPTRKNILVENFLPENGFIKSADGEYVRTLVECNQIQSSDFPMNIEGPL